MPKLQCWKKNVKKMSGLEAVMFYVLLYEMKLLMPAEGILEMYVLSACTRLCSLF